MSGSFAFINYMDKLKLVFWEYTKKCKINMNTTIYDFMPICFLNFFII